METSADYGDTVVVRRRYEEPVRDEHVSVEEHPSASPAIARERREDVGGQALHWPVHWNAIWVGGLVALTLIAILGLVASAIGYDDAARHATNWAAFTRAALISSIFTSLISFFVGGFMAVKITRLQNFERAILHGAIVWLVVLPVLLILGTIGAGHLLGYFASGLVGPPNWVPPAAGNVVVDPVSARAASNVSLAAMFAMVMGLIGGMLGGWLASLTEEPSMLRSLHRTRRPAGFRP